MSQKTNKMFIKKKCKWCQKIRKFLVDSDRDKSNICGECWDWVENP